MLAGNGIERIDGAVPKVANQQTVCERTEVAGGESDSPWCIEPGSVLQPSQQVSTSVEDAGQTDSRTMIFVFCAGLATSERYDEISTNVLNVKRDVVAETSVVVVCDLELAATHEFEGAVENIHAAGFEIRRVEEGSSARLHNGNAFVDRILGTVFFQDRVSQVDLRIPRGDRAVFGDEDEHRI